MNKTELITAIATKTQVSQNQASTIVTAMLDVIVESVAAGDKVTLIGFGSFEFRERAAREGRNPKTGEPMTIAASKVPVFSPGKVFKEKVKPNT